MTVADINMALSMNKIEPIYGMTHTDSQFGSDATARPGASTRQGRATGSRNSLDLGEKYSPRIMSSYVLFSILCILCCPRKAESRLSFLLFDFTLPLPLLIPHFLIQSSLSTKIPPHVYAISSLSSYVVEVMRIPLPPCPLQPEVSLHWLAVHGSQPMTAENPSVQPADAEDRPLALPKELQVHFTSAYRAFIAHIYFSGFP